MEIVRELVAPVPPAALFHHVGDLGMYPAWMPLIHDVQPLDAGADGLPVWSVELRATVGPFARSKRLRIQRTHHAINELAVFERSENDDRQHSPWTLRVAIVPIDEDDAQTRLTMTLSYGGSLWAGPILERVLDDQVRRGSEALLALVS